MKLIFSLFIFSNFILLSCHDSKTTKERVLPIVGNRDVNYYEVDGKEVADTVYPVVPDFKYLNEDSIMVDSKNLKGKIWIADFFFSNCPTICPPMTSQLKRLNTMTKDLSQHIEFMSFTIDPERDTPSRLREYKKEHGITAKNWNFFTGTEKATHALAKEFYNGAQRDQKADGGFMHTDTFVLIDKEGLVRGLYIGTDTKSVNQLEKDIRKLLEYEYNIK